MRFPVSLMLACLLTAGLVGLSPASAEPGHECNEDDVSDGNVRVTVRRDCSLEVVALEDTACIGGSGGYLERDVDRHTVGVYYCTPPIEPAAANAAETTVSGCGDLHGDSVLVAFALRSDCTVAVGVIDGQRVCGFNGLGWDGASAHAGGNDVYVDYCVPYAAVPALPSPCPDQLRTFPGGTLYTHGDCSSRVDLKPYDCVGDCEWHTVLDTPLVEVRYHGQSDAPAPLPPEQCSEKDYLEGTVRVSRDADCTADVAVLEGIICVGGWGGSVGHEVRGHEVRAYYCDGGLSDRIALDDLALESPAAMPGCKPRDEAPANGVRIEQEHNCRVTATTKFYDCVWGGHYEELTVGPVTWRDYRCSPPSGPASATEAAAAPVDWCEVRDDTPAPLHDPVWGRYDERPDGECDVDVEPFGACVGGGGSYVENRYDPVHAKILVCGPGPGGLPPIS